MKTIAFFNSKGGVGKTSLVYHLAWMFTDNGVATLAVDLDPRASLTAMFLDAEHLESLWPDTESSRHGIRQYPADIAGGAVISRLPMSSL